MLSTVATEKFKNSLAVRLERLITDQQSDLKFVSFREERKVLVS